MNIYVNEPHPLTFFHLNKYVDYIVCLWAMWAPLLADLLFIHAANTNMYV